MKRFFQMLLILFVSTCYIFAQGEDAGVPKTKTKPAKTKVSPAPKTKSTPKPSTKTVTPKVTKKIRIN